MVLTSDRLKELLHYDPDTGLFTRLVRRRGVQAGSIAGSKHNRGYWSIMVDGQPCLAHRLAFLYMTGDWPKDQIDHINGSKDDNRWVNLRPATPVQNAGNCSASKNNTSGYKGVHWRSRDGVWSSTIRFNGKQKWLGSFETPEQAHAAYVKAAEELFGSFARAA